MADPSNPGYRGWPITMWLGRGIPFTGIVKFSDVGGSAEMVDLTNQDSLEGYKEKLKALRDGGQFTVELSNPSATTIADILAAYEGDDLIDFTFWFKSLTGESKGRWLAKSSVVGYKASGGIGEKMSVTVTIEISGPWDFSE